MADPRFVSCSDARNGSLQKYGGAPCTKPSVNWNEKESGVKIKVMAGILTVGVASLTGCSSESVFDLEVGTCFNVSLDAVEISRVPTVDCAEPHDAEVFYVYSITDITSYDEMSVYDSALGRCIEEFEGWVGVDYYDEQAMDLDVYAMYPLEEGWSLGERGVVCSIISWDMEEQLTGSTRNSF